MITAGAFRPSVSAPRLMNPAKLDNKTKKIAVVIF
jgi:hypothetical protein